MLTVYLGIVNFSSYFYHVTAKRNSLLK